MLELRIALKESLKHTLRVREGYKFDQANYLIDQAEYLFECRICDEKVFRNLIPCTWVLRDGEAPRTIEAVVERIKRDFGDLARLTDARPVPDKSRDWYDRISTLRERFSWRLMGPVFVTPVKGWRKNGANGGDNELVGTPTASFSILSGLHCSLAAMYRIMFEGEVFQPVDAILVLPRVDY